MTRASPRPESSKPGGVARRYKHVVATWRRILSKSQDRPTSYSLRTARRRAETIDRRGPACAQLNGTRAHRHRQKRIQIPALSAVHINASDTSSSRNSSSIGPSRGGIGILFLDDGLRCGHARLLTIGEIFIYSVGYSVSSTTTGSRRLHTAPGSADTRDATSAPVNTSTSPQLRMCSINRRRESQGDQGDQTKTDGL